MKKVNAFVLMFVVIVLLSVAVFSQLSPITFTINKISQITSTINLEEKDICTTEFYDEVQAVFGDYNYYDNHTRCLNTSGPDTDCSSEQDIQVREDKIGEVAVTKNTTECKPNNEFTISIDQGTAVLKKQIDYSEWGPCIYSQENSCLIVTCVSLYDGAHKGQFIDCKGGKSCQRFEICDNSIKTLYKNSREDFVAEDDAFYLDKLPVKEVSK